MRFTLERFSTLEGVAIVVGWCDGYRPGDQIEFLIDGVTPMLTTAVPVARPDVAAVFGDDAMEWGFRCYGIMDERVAAGRLSLRFPSGGILYGLSQQPPSWPDASHGLWFEFCAEVNATGGRVLEIGAHPRTSSSFRSQFGDNVEYIGTDIRPGENVDIACDAHHLSDYVAEPVDYIFSHSTFEHLLMPWKAVLEMNKILKTGGKAFTHSHQSWPLHEVPFDYLRFSRESWAGLFSPHAGFRVLEARQGVPLSTSAHHTSGGLENMDAGLCYGNSVCIAQKTGPAMVSWDVPMSIVQDIRYDC